MKFVNLSMMAMFLLIGTVTKAFEQTAYPNAISVNEAKVLLDADRAVLIDVREQNEVSEGMAMPALWYAKSKIDLAPEEFVQYVNGFEGKNVILYCRSGRRVAAIIESFKNQIYVYNMGGYQEWVKAGYPTKLP